MTRLFAGLLLTTLSVSSVFFASAVAHAECVGHQTPRWAGHHSLVLLLNPTGAEYNGRLGLCVSLYEDDEPALSQNHFEAGVSTYLTPIYAVPGAYVQLSPATFFYIRAEIAAIGIWSIPLAGSGYYPRAGYGGSWQSDDVPADSGESAYGWTARVRATLRGSVDLSPGLSAMLVISPWVEVNALDHGDFYLDVRDDVIAANGDWVFAAQAALVLGMQIPDGPQLRFGAFNDMRWVPSSGYVAHRFGPIAMASFPWPDAEVETIDLFLRLGFYTNHRFRAGQLATMAGVAVDHDIGGL